MIIGRLLAGIGIGISSAIVPLYISEVGTWCISYCCHIIPSLYILKGCSSDTLSEYQISPTEIRGALGSVNQLFICIGILVALVAGLPLAANPLWYVAHVSIFFDSLSDMHKFYEQQKATSMNITEQSTAINYLSWQRCYSCDGYDDNNMVVVILPIWFLKFLQT